MLDFFRDLMYVLAALASILQYKHNGIEQLALVVVAYGFMAVMFQFTSHILERVKIKKLDELKFAKNVFVIVSSMVITTIIANLLIPIPALV